MSYIFLNETEPAYQPFASLNGFGQLGNGAMAEVDRAIAGAKAKRDAALANYNRITAGGITTPAALEEKRKVNAWANEVAFLERLKPLYESQTGVALKHRHYPVTKTDPATKKSGPNTPWRLSPTRQAFSSLEAGGSFCLGASRGMAFRSVFGLDRPTNIKVLTDLKKDIEAAVKAKDVATEARLIISRIVSHLHDPGSMKQFNQDVASRYGVKNVAVRSATRSEALDALKKGAPVIADLQGGWHWVLVHRSPLGQLWASDPLRGSGIRKTSSSELGSRFELIVDATSGDPIIHNAGSYKN